MIYHDPVGRDIFRNVKECMVKYSCVKFFNLKYQRQSDLIKHVGRNNPLFHIETKTTEDRIHCENGIDFLLWGNSLVIEFGI